MNLFQRKTIEQLKALTYPRIKSYFRAEQKRRGQQDLDKCECCGVKPYSDDQRKQFEDWQKYLDFVKAIMKEKEKEYNDVNEL